MASRRFFEFDAASSSASSLHSCVSESPVFHSPRSMSPVDDEMRGENTEASPTEITCTPLITDENHYGTPGDHDELPMSLNLRRGTPLSSSLELSNVSLWKRIR